MPLEALALRRAAEPAAYYRRDVRQPARRGRVGEISLDDGVIRPSLAVNLSIARAGVARRNEAWLHSLKLSLAARR